MMESENENDSSESLDMELNRSIRRSHRLSSQNRVEVEVEESDEASWRHSTHSSTRGRGRGRGRGRTSSHANQSSSEDFEEKESHKRSLRHDSSRSSDEKRRHRSGYEWKEESVRVDRVDRVASDEEAESRGGHTLHQINERVGERENEFESQDEDELEGGYANTVVTKGGVLLTLPEINPPPEMVVRSMRVAIGCGLCSRRNTSDMISCVRCGAEFHAKCLYGDELDYNSWLCRGCVSVLSALSASFGYLEAQSEYVPGDGLAPMGYPERVVSGVVSGIEVKSENAIEVKREDSPQMKEDSPDAKKENTPQTKENTPQTNENTLTQKKRLAWLLSYGEDIIGSRVWLKELNLFGFVLYRMTDLLLFYVVFEGDNDYRNGWYALEKGEVCVVKEFVWVRRGGVLSCGVRVEYEDGRAGEVYDLEKNCVVSVEESEVSRVRDWREHRLEMEFTALYDIVKWEYHLRQQLRKFVSKPFKVPSHRSEMSGKEWMYKWVYVWSRSVDYPFGGWSRGVVLHYRSITGKHFVLFENESVHSGWMYLNTSYVVCEGVCNEWCSCVGIMNRDLMALQPASEEHCWCCLRGACEHRPLYKCTKCGLFCHPQCCDPVMSVPLSEEESKRFVCFKCTKCRGCGTEVSFYGRWEQRVLCGERVLCCEECNESYNEGLFCNVCLKTMSVDESKECVKCSACGGFVHRECEVRKKKKEGRRREDSVFEEGGNVESEEESVEVGASYRCPCCRRKQMMEVLEALKKNDPMGIFLHPISEEFAPNYYDVIPKEKSVCLDVMESRVKHKVYASVQQVREDFELMCHNAFLYNAMGDEVWKWTATFYEKGESYLNSEWKETQESEYVEKIGEVKAMKTKLSVRPEASTNAKQASMEASKMVRYIEKCKMNGSKLEACSPLPAPYSVIEFPTVTERILPRYSSTISYDVCLSCGSSGDRDRMLFCGDCGECYHIYCVNLSGTITPEMRCGWRCSNCKVCEVCGLSLASQLGNVDVICSCNRCDRSFHKACLHYTDEENLNLFVCGYCFECKKCGVKGTPTTWSYHKDYCRECYNKEERFRQCAICNKPWSGSDVDMAFCESCEQWIHRRCIANDMLEWQKCDLTRSPYHCKRCRQQEVASAGAAMASLSKGYESRVSTMQRSVVSEIQEQRQQFRLKELLQQDTRSRSQRVSGLESSWRELVRTIIRVGVLGVSESQANSILLGTLSAKSEERSLNENGESRRGRLRGNKVAEDITERSRTFVSSRVESHALLGESIRSLVVSELEGKDGLELDSVSKLSDGVLEKVRDLYSSFLLLTEDACNAAGYLYTMQGVVPSLFDPVSPFTPTEWMLISGNVALPSFPLTPPAEESASLRQSEGNDADASLKSDASLKPSEGNETPQPHEVVGLFGLAGHRLEDPRSCDLCGLVGDHPVAGRLLCIPTGEWVHLNCVYYSSTIAVDEKTGAIQKYTLLKNHCRNTPCYLCNRPGASIKCCYQGCQHYFHFVCGRENNCLIRVNKEAFCHRHRPGLHLPRPRPGLHLDDRSGVCVAWR